MPCSHSGCSVHASVGSYQIAEQQSVHVMHRDDRDSLLQQEVLDLSDKEVHFLLRGQSGFLDALENWWYAAKLKSVASPQNPVHPARQHPWKFVRLNKTPEHIFSTLCCQTLPA